MGVSALSRALGWSLAVALLLPVTAVTAGENRPRVELRVVRRSPTPGYSVVPGPHPQEKLFLADRALFSDRDFTGIRMASVGGSIALLISFAPEASKRLAKYTRKHRGREIALALDGRVLLVTQLGDPIEGGEMTLIADLSVPDARAVCDALRPARSGP